MNMSFYIFDVININFNFVSLDGSSDDDVSLQHESRNRYDDADDNHRSHN